MEIIKTPERMPSSPLLELVNTILISEDLPPRTRIGIDIYFSPHVSAADFSGITRRFDRSDIFIPELFGWDDIDLGLYNGISQGVISQGRYDTIFSLKRDTTESAPYVQGELDLLRGSK